MTNDHIVLILGIARSGTSAVAGALCAAGVDFGTAVKPKDPQNPKGNFEDFPLSRLNQDILSSCSRTWSSLRPLPRNWQNRPQVARTKSAIKQELVTRFTGRGLVGLKDPRLVALLPLYLDILNDLNLAYTLITTSRADGEVRRSIAQSGYFHGRFEPLKVPFLIKRYRADLRDIATRHCVHNVEFKDLFSAAGPTLDALVAAVPFGPAGVTPDLDAAVAHIDPQLYRSRAAESPSL